MIPENLPEDQNDRRLESQDGMTNDFSSSQSLANQGGVSSGANGGANGGNDFHTNEGASADRPEQAKFPEQAIEMNDGKSSRSAELLGYLLGALDAREHRKVDLELAENVELRTALDAMRNRLVPLARVDQWLKLEQQAAGESFPAGLARRTCESIARRARKISASPQVTVGPEVTGSPVSDATTNQVAPKKPVSTQLVSTQLVSAQLVPAELVSAPVVSMPAVSKPGDVSAAGLPLPLVMSDARLDLSSEHAWSLADFVVLTAVAVLVMAMLTPAVLASRNQSRLVACQDNLRRIGTGLFNYAESHEDHFVPIAKDGPLNVAGAYAPVLRTGGFVDDDGVFFCSTAVASGLQEVKTIPTIEELQRAYRQNSEHLAELQSMMGGSYGYSLGYYDHDRYVGPINLGRSFRVIMADTPSYLLEGRASKNHGGQGQNLLFEDGGIRFSRQASVGFPADSIFENRNGLIAAGTDVNDSVIGSSNVSAWISPGIYSGK